MPYTPGDSTSSRARNFTQSELDSVANSSYFQRTLPQREDQGRSYDALFHPREGYEPRVSRDDMAINLTLDINKEERSRQMPVCSSCVYGWRVHTPLEAPYKKNVRVQMVNKGFFRSRGTCIPLQTEIAELNDKCQPQ